MTSKVDICNLAIAHVEGARISSFSENTPEAILCNSIYAMTRDSLLRSHKWNFAIKRATLAPLATAPEYGYDYQYQLPIDCLRVVKLEYVGDRYKIEGRKLLCNDSSLKLKYIYRNEEVNEYDPVFVEALAYKISEKLAFPIASSNKLALRMEAKYKTIVSEARSFDGQEDTRDPLQQYVWENARINGANEYDPV